MAHHQGPRLKPRIIIHGGAGNIQPTYPPEVYEEYRSSLLTIISKTEAYMTNPSKPPSALSIATHAVSLLEDNPLFNSGHGAVFTRDGINQLEASVMVSRGHAKRGVGVMGLRHVRNPIKLARCMLEHGDEDLRNLAATRPSTASEKNDGSQDGSGKDEGEAGGEDDLDVPSAQGHTQLWGQSAEQLARAYGLEMVEPSYFFTQRRWDEHMRALERERRGGGTGCWDAGEYVSQGTCGAVAMDSQGVVCAATSTGGMTNKLTGRVGDTPVPGAGFWAEEWVEEGDPTGEEDVLGRMRTALSRTAGSLVTLTEPLRGLLADCLPTPLVYTPVGLSSFGSSTTTTRSMATSGTGNGDSFLRVNAGRTVGAMARWKPESSARALSNVTGPGGELQRSAGDRWGRTGEGEGGMIGIECAVVRDGQGEVVGVRSEVLMDYNCGGMFRAWIDDEGRHVMSIWTNHGSDEGWDM